MTRDEKPAYLLLEDGYQAEGRLHAADGSFTAEIVFHTALTGYPELFTDPSFYGQFLVMTNVHIGNYGTAESEWQYRRPTVSGIVVRHLSTLFSRAGKALGLLEYFRVHQIPILEGVDTRALVRHLRTKGAQKALITSEGLSRQEAANRLAASPGMQGSELASAVTTPEPYFLGQPKRPRVAVLDYGVKQAILDQLLARGALVGVFPAHSRFDADSPLRAFEPDAFLLSNGPGDPAAMPYAIQTAQDLIQTRKPILGICLGHQILSLALGVPTYKLLYGHRGSNHPVKDLRTGRLFITSQNHGFAIDKSTLDKHPDLVLTHLNLNDHTVEGFTHRHWPVQGVQYHPEAAPGPHDANVVFEEFFDQIAVTLPAKSTPLT